MNINSIKQTLSPATAQPVYELVKLISNKIVGSKLAEMLTDITVTTVCDYLDHTAGVPVREVRVSSAGYVIELVMVNKVDTPILLGDLHRLHFIWSDENGTDFFDLKEMLAAIDSLEVGCRIIGAMRHYNNLAVSRHSIKVRYRNYLEEGEEVSSLQVTIDKIRHLEVVKLELPEDDDESMYTSTYSRHLLLSKFITRLLEDEEFSEI